MTDWYQGGTRATRCTVATKEKTQGCALSYRLRGGFAFGRMVFARDGAHGDGEAVPRIDSGDGVGEVDKFVFREFLARRFVQPVGRGVLGTEGQGVGAGQRRTYARRAAWR